VLFELFPQLRGKLPWSSLGTFPTPVEDASRVLGPTAAGSLWLKRDDLSSPVYGGNKVRLLEPLLAAVQHRGARRVYATGAVGSNFVVATVLHAPRIGLGVGAICFRQQPLTVDAERARQVISARADSTEIAHWSLLPIASKRVERDAARGERVEVLSQVALSPDALLGYVAGGLELARQIANGECAAPTRIVLPIGSAATSAGLLAGLSLAKRLGILKRDLALCAVRIAPWPLSRRARVTSLAERALRRLAQLAGRGEYALRAQQLLPFELVVDQLGKGYAEPTPAARAARELFAQAGYPLLDETYTAKAAAHVLASIARTSGPTLLWCTKSSAPLP